MENLRQKLDRDDWKMLITVLACCLFVGTILIVWSRLRGY